MQTSSTPWHHQNHWGGTRKEGTEESDRERSRQAPPRKKKRRQATSLSQGVLQVVYFNYRRRDGKLPVCFLDRSKRPWDGTKTCRAQKSLVSQFFALKSQGGRVRPRRAGGTVPGHPTHASHSQLISHLPYKAEMSHNRKPPLHSAPVHAWLRDQPTSPVPQDVTLGTGTPAQVRFFLSKPWLFPSQSRPQAEHTPHKLQMGREANRTARRRMKKQKHIHPPMSTLYWLLYYEVFLGGWGHNIFSHPLEF